MHASIRSKILVAFGAMAVLTGALGWHAAEGIGESGRLVVATFDKSLMSISYARAAAADFADMQLHPAAGATARDALAASLQEDLAIAAERAHSARAGGAARAAWQAAEAWQRAAIGGDAVAQDAAAAAVAAQIDLLVNFTAGDAFAHREQALAEIAAQRRLGLAATIGALLTAGLVTWMLTRRIVGPVGAASRAAARIAGGALDTPIPRGAQDELGALLAAMAVMRDNISAMMEAEIAGRRSAQHRLLAAVESSGEGVLLVDPDGTIALANSQLAAFLPGAAELLRPGVGFAEMIAAAVAAGCFVGDDEQRATLQARLEERRGEAIELQLADGRWLRIGRSAAVDGGTVLICGDITTLRRHAAELERTNLWFANALDSMAQGLVMFDAGNKLRVANRRFAEFHGLDPDQLTPGLDYPAFLALCEPRCESGRESGRDPGGTLLRERLATIAARAPRAMLRDRGDGRQLAILFQPTADGGWLATYEDVTERRAAEERLAYVARHDVLTGLANRAELDAQLGAALQQATQAAPHEVTSFALFCLDLDGFKNVNDVLGHHGGDALLRIVAERLCASADGRGTVARLGGDEFAVLLRAGASAADAVLMAQELLAALRAPFVIGDESVSCGASIGIVLAPADGTEPATLLRNADTALHRAKQDGRGIYQFFEQGMDARLQARRSLELDLRRAVEAGAFQLAYQPLIEAAGERLCGFEALLRWHHPARGAISPAEFIPVAEETGLIVAIGEWVLREATREAARWPAHVKVAVNVSPLQFRHPDLVAMVEDALAASGLPAGRLELEITESVMIEDTSGVLATLERLHALGLRISMDDFGTGYSSLSTLRSFPFDKLKIDQSFIRDLGAAAESRTIVRAIVAMGLSLGMRVTAEGVEHASQLAILREEGCTEIQGYFYSRPRPAADAPELIARWGGLGQGSGVRGQEAMKRALLLTSAP